MRRFSTSTPLLLAIVMLACADPALAHSSARGFVLLLPTGLVILGGAIAVLITFAAVSLMPDSVFLRMAEAGKTQRPVAPRATHVFSLASAVILVILVWIGFAGPHDPAENLLPLTIWTVWWVVIVLLHPIFGNLWATLNPFTGLHALLRRNAESESTTLSYWPAVVIFAASAWFQLVYPGPADPGTLAWSVLVYAILTLLAVFVFGPTAWFSRGDPFAVFMAQLGAAAPVGQGLALRVPGAGLVGLASLPISGTLFVLLTLSSISFDGFANTFLWLSSIGVNPLDFPGRTALVLSNSLGLGVFYVLLAIVYMACVAAGWSWSGTSVGLRSILGRFVFSLIPISIAYHFAHYLSDTLVQLQYFALALNDPFGNGANLLDLGHHRVTASFQNTASGTLAIFTLQTAAIIIGHAVGVAVAHASALQFRLSRSATLKLEAPLAAFMVFYTAFSLWLLATPSIT